MPSLLYRRITQQVASKRRDQFNKIHRVTPHKRVIFTLSPWELQVSSSLRTL